MKFHEIDTRIRILIWVVLIIVTATVLYPVFWVVCTAFRPEKEIIQNVYGLPTHVYIENIKNVWSSSNFGIYFLNSIVVTSFSVVGIILLSASAAYVFTRFNFKGKKFWFIYLISGLIVPNQVLLIANFKIMSLLHLINTRISLILTYLGWVPLAVFFLHAYFLSIPQELDESARIDGASYSRIFFSIILPLAKPALVMMAVFYSILVWNDFLWPLIYISEESLFTVALGLARFQGTWVQYWGRLTAAISISCWPPIILFIILHKHLVQAITKGSLKM